jgi:hypothetical protein
VSEPKYQTILPDSERTEIGPLEEDARPIDPAFIEWWKNKLSRDEAWNDKELAELALSAWQAHDAKIARLEAGLEHFRNSPLPAKIEHLRESIAKALNVAVQYGGIDGIRHKAWVIDQMVRALTGDKYDALVAKAKSGEDGPDTYSWDCGVAP